MKSRNFGILILLGVWLVMTLGCRSVMPSPTSTPDPSWPPFGQPDLDLVLVGEDDPAIVDIVAAQVWPLAKLVSASYESPRIEGQPWSPNGYQFVFQTQSPLNGSEPVTHILLADALQRSVRILYQGSGVYYYQPIYWSHDGRFILFLEEVSDDPGLAVGQKYRDRLTILDVHSGEAKTLYEASDPKSSHSPQASFSRLQPFGWSYDDHWLGLISQVTDEFEVILIDMTTSRVTRLPEKDGTRWAQWSAIKNEIFLGYEPFNPLPVGAPIGFPTKLFGIDVPALKSREIADGSFISAAWSPDGSRVAFWDRRRVCVLETATDRKTCPINLPPNAGMPFVYPTITWSSDGQRLAFPVGEDSGARRIGYIVGLSGEVLTRSEHLFPNVFWPPSTSAPVSK